MKVILCLDDHLGYSFNRRRQSRDRKMRAHMLGVLREEGSGLLMNAYSEASFLRDGQLFTPEEEALRRESPAGAGDAFLADAAAGKGWAFVENCSLERWLDSIDEMIVYRWNRLYLSDLRLPEGFLDGFETTAEEEFEGSSHDRMTYLRLIRRTEES